MGDIFKISSALIVVLHLYYTMLIIDVILIIIASMKQVTIYVYYIASYYNLFV